jgi:hypothetical protein
METANAIVTLRVAEERDKQVWVTEDIDEVLARVNDPEAPRLITFTRVCGMEGHPFYTRPDNVVNVEANV